MLEIIIFSFCISRTNDDGCYSSARAYSQYSKLDKEIDYNIQRYNREYKELAYLSMVVGTATNKTVTFPIFNSKFILNTDFNDGYKYIVTYKMGW